MDRNDELPFLWCCVSFGSILFALIKTKLNRTPPLRWYSGLSNIYVCYTAYMCIQLYIIIYYNYIIIIIIIIQVVFDCHAAKTA